LQLLIHESTMKICSSIGRLKLGRLQPQKYQKLIDIECLDATPLLLPPADDVNDDAPVCYICLDNGPDEGGQPIRRDCSCRGSDCGFAHLSCLVEYAKQKTEEWDGYSIGDLSEPWVICPCCLQPYQNKLAVELATEFVSFVVSEHSSDLLLYLYALDHKLCALVARSINGIKMKTESIQIANTMLFVIRKLKTDRRYRFDLCITIIESSVYNRLGQITLVEDFDGYKKAIKYFEKCRDLSKAVHYSEGVAIADNNIIGTKKVYGKDISSDEYMKQALAFYQLQFDMSGQGSVDSLKAGVNLAIALKGTNQRREAEELLSRLVEISKRFHGSNHNITKLIESERVQKVAIGVGKEWKLFKFVKFKEDGNNCIVQGPILEPRCIQTEKMFTVASDIVFSA